MVSSAIRFVNDCVEARNSLDTNVNGSLPVLSPMFNWLPLAADGAEVAASKNLPGAASRTWLNPATCACALVTPASRRAGTMKKKLIRAPIRIIKNPPEAVRYPAR